MNEEELEKRLSYLEKQVKNLIKWLDAVNEELAVTNDKEN